jgi:hypothetical protein
MGVVADGYRGLGHQEVAMPFRSEAQRRFMWANHPRIAKRWSKEGPNKGLPRKVRKSGRRKKK